MVQNWVRNNAPAELVDEIAFMDIPDRRACGDHGQLAGFSINVFAFAADVDDTGWGR
jgi:hypothetical protein